jgi:hypothetical protein
MSLLICLKVKYGFPVYSLYGFLKNKDHETWESFLENLTYEISVSPKDNQIFILINNCENPTSLKSELDLLPLLKEEFLEMHIHEFTSFKTLDCLFKRVP